MADSENTGSLYYDDKKNIEESGECKLYGRPSGAVDVFIKKDVGEKINVGNHYPQDEKGKRPGIRYDVILYKNGDIILKRKTHGADANS